MTMIKIFLAKADPIVSHEDIPGVEIRIAGKLPEFTSLENAEAVYEYDAAQLMEALFENLPQGTRWRLFLKMMEKYPQYLRGK